MNPSTMRRADLAFWWRWVDANAAAELIGLGTVAVAGVLVARRWDEPQGLGPALAVAALFVLLGAFEGAVVGWAQARVLRRRLPALEGWVGASVVGAVAAWILGLLPSTLMSLHPAPAGAAPPALDAATRLLLAVGLGAVAGPLHNEPMEVSMPARVRIVLAALFAALAATPAQAESLRCNGASAAEGDSRLSLLYKCGPPLLVDQRCAAVAAAPAWQSLPDFAIGLYLPCLPVEDWLYDRGPGNLMATVRLRSGVVQSIRYGRLPQ